MSQTLRPSYVNEKSKKMLEGKARAGSQQRSELGGDVTYSKPPEHKRVSHNVVKRNEEQSKMF